MGKERRKGIQSWRYRKKVQGCYTLGIVGSPHVLDWYRKGGVMGENQKTKERDVQLDKS